MTLSSDSYQPRQTGNQARVYAYHRLPGKIAMQGETDDLDAPRSGGLVSSQGIEWSLIWLAIGVVGMVFLFFSVIGTRSTDQPSYDRDSQIAPRPIRETPQRNNQPEVGNSTEAESA